MPNYIRAKTPGGTYFFTVNLAQRGSHMLVDRIAELRAVVKHVKRARPFAVDAWVVLPDHMHMVWTLPPGDADFSVRIGSIKAQFSMAVRRAGFIPPPPIGKTNGGVNGKLEGVVNCRANGGVNPALRRKGEVGLWQPRFWEHHIRTETDYWNHIRYCWMNPVKHGFVDRPQDW